MGKGLSKFAASLEEDRGRTGETIVCGPEQVQYKGAVAPPYAVANSSGYIALTDQRLVFKQMLGAQWDIKVSDMVPATLEKDFRGHGQYGAKKTVGVPDVNPGNVRIVFRTKDNGVAFLLKEPEAWQKAVEKLIGEQKERNANYGSPSE